MVSTAPKRAEKIADTESTVRLTVAQATVRFLGNQYVEHDGDRTKFFAGAFGIFGHGNVAGLGQALLQDESHRIGVGHRTGAALRVGPQRTGHGAQRRRLRSAEGPAADLGRDRQRGTRLDEHADRRGAGDHQPAARPAATRGHVRHPGQFACAAGTRAAVLRRRHRQRRVQAGVAVLRPGLASRTAARRADRRDAGAHRPRRDRGSHRLHPPGRTGRGARLAGIPVRRTHLAHRPAAAGAVGDRARSRGHPQRPQAADRRRWWRHLLRRHRCARRVLRADRYPGGPEPGRQGITRLRPPAVRRRHRVHRHHRGQRAWPPRPTWSSE